MNFIYFAILLLCAVFCFANINDNILSENNCINCENNCINCENNCINCENNFNAKRNNSNLNNSIMNSEGLIKSLNIFENKFKIATNYYQNIVKNIKPIEHKLKESFINLFQSLNISDNCLSALFQLTDGMKRNEFSALKCKNILKILKLL